jgi:hypothetical protein
LLQAIAVRDHYQIVVFGELEEKDLSDAVRRLLDFLRDHRYVDAPIAPEPHSEEKLRPWLAATGLAEVTIDQEIAKTQARLSRRRAFVSGEAAGEAVAGPPVPSQCPDAAFGVELVLGWEVHGDAEAEYSTECPGCDAELRELHLWKGPLADATSRIEEDPRAELPCDACNGAWPLRDWTFHPPLYVSILALRFGNWGPLAPSFVGGLERAARSRAQLTSETV